MWSLSTGLMAVYTGKFVSDFLSSGPTDQLRMSCREEDTDAKEVLEKLGNSILTSSADHRCIIQHSIAMVRNIIP